MSCFRDISIDISIDPSNDRQDSGPKIAAGAARKSTGPACYDGGHEEDDSFGFAPGGVCRIGIRGPVAQSSPSPSPPQARLNRQFAAQQRDNGCGGRPVRQPLCQTLK